MTKTGRKGPGRPPSGPAGEKVKDYPRMGLRLPPATFARLRAWSEITGTPSWRLCAEAIEAAVGQLEGADAADVKRLARRYVERYRQGVEA